MEYVLHRIHLRSSHKVHDEGIFQKWQQLRRESLVILVRKVACRLCERVTKKGWRDKVDYLYAENSNTCTCDCEKSLKVEAM